MQQLGPPRSEAEIIRFVSQGKSNKEIAAELFVSEVR